MDKAQISTHWSMRKEKNSADWNEMDFMRT